MDKAMLPYIVSSITTASNLNSGIWVTAVPMRPDTTSERSLKTLMRTWSSRQYNVHSTEGSQTEARRNELKQILTNTSDCAVVQPLGDKRAKRLLEESEDTLTISQPNVGIRQVKTTSEIKRFHELAFHVKLQ